MNKVVFVTGADGFVGGRAVDVLSKKYDVMAGVRKLKPTSNLSCKTKACEIDGDTYWGDVLPSVDTVVHLAAVAHGNSDDPSYISEVNVSGALNLAKQAAIAGVRRFIFLSSIGVNGVNNTSPFCVNDTPSPSGYYAMSKLRAEIGLKKVATEMGMELVIIRPPLVYGSNAPGNFGHLAKLAKISLPLPLGAIHNKRSLVSLDNLVDLIVTCIEHPSAANQTFLVSDDYDVSTTHLLRMMIESAGKKPMLIPVPLIWLSVIAGLLGKKCILEKMCSSLQVDISFTKETLGWKPPVSFENGILKCFVKE
jgi:UDP-glucose 4-epimerase